MWPVCTYCGIRGDRFGNCDTPPIVKDYQNTCDQYKRAIGELHTRQDGTRPVQDPRTD